MSEPLIFGRHDEATLRQIRSVMESGAAHFVECADGHLGYGHPIGGVAAYRDHISLSGVGFDIGCGNGAIRTRMSGTELRPRVEEVMDEIVDTIAFGIGRKRTFQVSDSDLYHAEYGITHSNVKFVRDLKDFAMDQLGTVGSGNHYVDLFVEEATNDVWVGVHFGSRGFGHKIATHYMREVGATDDMMSPPALIEFNSPLGRDYAEAMTIAADYASRGRAVVINAILKILGAEVVRDSAVNNHHNFAWRETHFGENFWVVRKGATPAFPGQRGFIGGSMGDDAVIVEGVDSELSRLALYSTVHGAGRVMSRSEARGKVKVDKGTGERRVVKEPKVDRAEWKEWLLRKGVALRGGDLDEAPQAYRRLDEVLKEHESTIKVLHRLSPIGVAMAGSDTHDPYKD